MNTLTLRQAHKVLEKLSNSINKININPEVSFNVWEVSAATSTAHMQSHNVFDAQKAKFQKDFEKALSLTKVRRELRNLIKQANSNEVDSLIAKRISIIEQLALYQRVLQYVDLKAITSSASFKQKVAATIEQRKSGGATSFGGDVVSCSMLNESEAELISSQINDLVLRKEQIEDAILHVNVATKINLSSEIVDVLTTEGLI